MLKSSHSRRWLPVLLAANLFSVTIDGSQSRHGHRRGGVPEDHSGTHVGAKKQTITIAGIFPITGVEGWQGGQACEPAAHLALEDVNNYPNLLPGYHLNMYWNDSGCDAGKGAAVMYDLLYTKPQKVLLLAGCSTVCTTVSEASQLFNLVTVCYGASSPALSNRQRFPTLFRTHPSATVHNPTRVRVFQRYKWSRISIIQEAEEVFSTTLDDLEARCKNAGINIDIRQSFLRNPDAAVANLKRQDARVIVGLFYAKAARKVLCEIYKQKLFGPKYVWFFIGWYEDDWFRNKKHLEEENINCTVSQMTEAAEGHFTTEALQWNQDDTETISGKTVDEFADQLKGLLRDNPRYAKNVDKGIMPEGYLEAPLAYDAIWAVALALNSTMAKLAAMGQTIEDYNYENKEIGNIILDQFGDVKFDGISGRVAFNEDTGDRIAWTKVEQLQDAVYEVVAFYDQKTDNMSWVNPRYGNIEDKVIWRGGKVPQDRTIVQTELMMVNLWLYGAMVFLVILGCVFASLFMYVNFKYSHRRIIRDSHPSCNNLMLVGVMFCLLALVPGGLDGRFVSPSVFPVACHLGTWLLTTGFSLSYGAMFSKIWRVHRITRMSKEDGKTAEVVPWKLWLAVAFLLLIDVILLTIWTVIDPLGREVRNFAKLASPNPDDDIEILPQLEHCKSKHHKVWLGIIYAYKGLQLILGLFLTYETRSQKVKQINDSRLVGMAVYNVVILCSITAPVMLLVGDQQNAAFCFVSLANIFCCYLSMALIYVPKILFIRKHAHDPREKEESEVVNRQMEQEHKKVNADNEVLKMSLKEREQELSILRLRVSSLKKRSSSQCSPKATKNGLNGKPTKPRGPQVSFSITKTTVTINEDPSTISEASRPTSTSPTTGPSCSSPQSSGHTYSSHSCCNSQCNPPSRANNGQPQYLQGGVVEVYNHDSRYSNGHSRKSTSSVDCEAELSHTFDTEDDYEPLTRSVDRLNGHVERTSVVKFANPIVGSCISDLERSASLKGITVFRGKVPKSTDPLLSDELYESYL